jgi:multidrug transporter EmrE-like cation transporter
MKIIQKESYLEYIKRSFKTLFTKSTNLTYTFLAVLVVAVCWYEDEFENMLRIVFLLINASIIMLFLGEILATTISKEINKSSFITELIAIIILVFISFVFYDENFRFWSFALGFMLFIPVILNIVFNRIRIWLNI